jgi:hypothetical protein
MRLEIASYKAIKFACLNFHYAKSVPVNVFGYSVFNKNNEWCGVILYGTGAANNIGEPFNLKQGQIVELVRMALNGKQESTTKCMAISLKLIKKNAPNLKLIVSYADSEQGHFGIIYQATNWFYIGFSIDTNMMINGKREHRRTLGSRYGTSSYDKLINMGLNVEIIKTMPKWKYIYPLHNSMLTLCNTLKKEYPKKAIIA